MSPGRVGYYVRWMLGRFTGRRVPLSCSIILTDLCNLHCRHCTVANLGCEDPGFDEVVRDLETLYATGSRVLIITGGEPFMWRDSSHRLDNVVAAAHDIGFFRVVVCTNGTFPLESAADYLWVSLDGFPEEHDELRGGVYARVMGNVRRSRHPGVSVNFTVSRINWADFDRAAQLILQEPRIRGVLFHLFTPYLGSDPELVLEPWQRREVVSRIWRMKQRYPLRVTNTLDGIRALARNRWPRPVWSSLVINRGRLTSCCCRAGIADATVCADCGCTPAVEMLVLQQMRPLALLENLRYL
jgi:MoaA/NifB/PqqE/SkfB family radical SAM enzyme